MKNDNIVVYESIVVLAVHMPDAEEIPFEENHEYIMEQYQKFLNDCVNIMHGNDCVDIVLFHNHIYGIYDGTHYKTGRDLETTGIRISRLVRAFNHNVEAYYAEKLLCGIGIAAGTATRVPLHSPFRKKEMWMGHVFDKAYSMARMSVCDGRRRVFVDDSAEGNRYR